MLNLEPVLVQLETHMNSLPDVLDPMPGLISNSATDEGPGIGQNPGLAHRARNSPSLMIILSAKNNCNMSHAIATTGWIIKKSYYYILYAHIAFHGSHNPIYTVFITLHNTCTKVRIFTCICTNVYPATFTFILSNFLEDNLGTF